MNDPESFLSRWSRRKQESNTAAGPEPAPAAPPAPIVAPADSVKPASVAVEPTREAAAPTPAPAFDPASLPPISSITQASDIRQFLQAGVPAELVRAALRAAWVADPAIRDFIGIADNQWDFNDPTAMPGFGPLEPADAARVFAQRSVPRVNEAAEAVERMTELATRSAVDAANMPREGQVDRVWLSAGMTEQGGSRDASVSLLPQTTPGSAAAAESTAVAEAVTAPEAVRAPAGAADPAAPSARPHVHGTALPKART